MNIGLKLLFSGLFLGIAAFLTLGAYVENDTKPPRWLPVLAVGSGLTTVVGALIWIWSA